MRVEDKKTASSVKPKAEPSKVTNNVDTAILPADPLDDALRADAENVISKNEHHAPSGNVFYVGKDDLQVVIGDKSRERQKFCVHGIIGARQTGASNEHEHQTQFS